MNLKILPIAFNMFVDDVNCKLHSYVNSEDMSTRSYVCQTDTNLSIACNYCTASYRKLDGGVGMRL